MQVGDIVEFDGERAIVQQMNDTFAEIKYTNYSNLNQVVPTKELKLLDSLSTCTIKVGSRIRFKGEKHFWKVRARDNRFLICVWRHFYTICDLQEGIRGKDNYIDAVYDYIDCLEIELREALYRLNLEEPTLLKDCKNLDDDIGDKWLKEINCFSQVSETQQWIDDIKISHRNYVPLIIEEIK